MGSIGFRMIDEVLDEEVLDPTATLCCGLLADDFQRARNDAVISNDLMVQSQIGEFDLALARHRALSAFGGGVGCVKTGEDVRGSRAGGISKQKRYGEYPNGHQGEQAVPDPARDAIPAQAEGPRTGPRCHGESQEGQTEKEPV